MTDQLLFRNVMKIKAGHLPQFREAVTAAVDSSKKMRRN